MSHSEKRGEIRCRSGLFSRQETRVTQLTEAINRACTGTEKAAAAEALTKEVGVLLECEEYDEGSAGCRFCRGVSELRHQTAGLVVKAGRLDDRSRRAATDHRRS